MFVAAGHFLHLFKAGRKDFIEWPLADRIFNVSQAMIKSCQVSSKSCVSMKPLSSSGSIEDRIKFHGRELALASLIRNVSQSGCIRPLPITDFSTLSWKSGIRRRAPLVNCETSAIPWGERRNSGRPRIFLSVDAHSIAGKCSDAHGNGKADK